MFGSLLVSLLRPGYYGDTFGYHGETFCYSANLWSIMCFSSPSIFHYHVPLPNKPSQCPLFFKFHWTLWNSWKHSFELALYIYVCISTEGHVLCHQQCWFHHYSLHINHITLTSITLFLLYLKSEISF